MNQHWYWLFFVLPVLIFVLIQRTAWFKGKLGEFKVNLGTSLHLDRQVYRLIKNVTLPVGTTDTTQIDHLVVSPYGIFVIETKNMKGWIFGQPDHAQWAQVIYQFKRRFQNPIRQNYMHVKAVRDLLGLTPDHVHSVVVFVSTCTFKTPMPIEVVHGVSGLVAFIQAKRAIVFTEDEVRRFIEVIMTGRLEPGLRTERTHVRNVKKRISDNSADLGIACPRCGDVMVERVERRTGERFLGCRRFPRCRGVRSLPSSRTSTST